MGIQLGAQIAKRILIVAKSIASISEWERDSSASCQPAAYFHDWEETGACGIGHTSNQTLWGEIICVY